MYCLVFFEDTKNLATVNSKDVRQKKNISEVKWGQEWIPAKILLKNENKLFLDNVEVDVNGVITKLPSMDVTSTKKSKKLSKKIIQKNVDSEIVNLPSIYEQTEEMSESTTRSHREFESENVRQEALTFADDINVKSGKKQKSAIEVDNLIPKKIKPYSRRGSSNVDVKKNESHHLGVTKKQKNISEFANKTKLYSCNKILTPDNRLPNKRQLQDVQIASKKIKLNPSSNSYDDDFSSTKDEQLTCKKPMSVSKLLACKLNPDIQEQKTGREKIKLQLKTHSNADPEQSMAINPNVFTDEDTSIENLAQSQNKKNIVEYSDSSSDECQSDGNDSPTEKLHCNNSEIEFSDDGNDELVMDLGSKSNNCSRSTPPVIEFSDDGDDELVMDLGSKSNNCSRSTSPVGYSAKLSNVPVIIEYLEARRKLIGSQYRLHEDPTSTENAAIIHTMTFLENSIGDLKSQIQSVREDPVDSTERPNIANQMRQNSNKSSGFSFSSKPSSSSSSPDESCSTEKISQSVVDEQMMAKLIQKTEMSVDKTDLLRNTKQYRGDQAEMARKIFKIMISVEQLANMTVTKTRGRETIPKKIYEAIEDYTQNTCRRSRRLSKAEFHKKMTAMCCTIRTELKKKKNNSKKKKK